MPQLFAVRSMATRQRGVHFFDNADDAVKDIPSGSKLLVGGMSALRVVTVLPWRERCIRCVFLQEQFEADA